MAHFDARDVWCDFIDPFAGVPFRTDSSTTLAECDERYRSLGFEILELGCCKALCDDKFGQCLVMTSAFVRASAKEVADTLSILEQAVSGEQATVITNAAQTAGQSELVAQAVVNEHSIGNQAALLEVQVEP